VQRMQGLAYAIVRDWQLSEDVGQEALVRALEGRAREGRVLHAWLMAVTRNLSLNALRERRRRREREARSAVPEAAPLTPAPLEVLEAHRALTAAIAALPADAREVVMLRFFEDLSFPEIARRLGVRAEAARMRLHRAIALLRSRLGGTGHDWHALCLLALPLNTSRALEAGIVTGGIVMGVKSTGLFGVLLASLLLLLGVAYWRIESAAPQPPEDVQAAELVHAQDAAPAEDPLRRAELEVVEPGSAAATPHTELPELRVRPRPVVARIYHDGHAVAGAHVEWRQAARSGAAFSDQEGIARLELDPGVRFSLIATKGGLRGRTNEWSATGLHVEMYDEARYSPILTVTDRARGEAIAGARVQLFTLPYYVGQSALPLASRSESIADGVTGPDGTLTVEALLRQEPTLARITAPGFHSYWGPVNSQDWAFSIGLMPGDDPDLILQNQQGEPLAGALIRVGEHGYEERILDSAGRVPGPLGWNRGARRGSLPKFTVRMPSGRWWYSGSLREPMEEGITWTDDRIEVRIVDEEVQALLESGPMLPGTWIEAIRLDGSYESILFGSPSRDPDLAGGPQEFASAWKRLELDVWVDLEGGWTGHGVFVMARLQPAGMLQRCAVENGRARIVPPTLCHLIVEVPNLTGAEVENWRLTSRGTGARQFTEPNPWSPRYGANGSECVDGVFEAWIPPGEYILALEDHARRRTHFWSGGAFRAGASSEDATPVALTAGAVPLSGELAAADYRRVRVLVDGHPVHGGFLAPTPIDAEGWTELQVDPEGRVVHRLGNALYLVVQPEVGSEQDAPVHAIRFLPANAELRLEAGDPAVLDFRLATFRIQPQGIDFNRELRLTICPIALDGTTYSPHMEQSGYGFQDSRYPFRVGSGGIPQLDRETVAWRYRVPAGRFRISLYDPVTQEHIWLTGPEGRDFAPGSETLLAKVK
jgi:RNA polymerase sigma factor (sigma-70 family)